MWKYFLICLLLSNYIAAQTVETIVVHSKIIDGIHVDPEGNIFTTPGGLMNGNAIGRATPTGDFIPDFKSGFNGPIDIDANTEGHLFITNYDNNSLKRYNIISGEIETILDGLDGPAGLTLDSSGNIFLTCFGAPPSYSGNQIIKVSPNGSSEIWLESSDFLRPQGITFDHQGNLWVSNTPTGKIYKIDTISKVPELIIELGARVGNVVFRLKDHLLYFTSQENHRIYRMSLEGDLEILAGSGAVGNIDGSALEASFNRPLGLGFTASEDTLYVAQAGSLRRIINLDISTKSTEDDLKKSFKIIPNPSHGSVNVKIPLQLKGKTFHAFVSNAKGQVIYQQEVSTTNENFTIDRLYKGVWYIRLSYENKIFAEKVIVL